MEIPILGTLIKTIARIKNIPVEYRQKHTDPVKAQANELKKLLKQAKNTSFGIQYGFSEILLADDIRREYARRVPIFDYNRMHDEWWYRALKGERNVSWPGKIKYFALSSGTSEAASKFIPVTRRMLRKITQAGIRQLVSATRYDFPTEFYKKGVLMIGGSTELKYYPEYDYYAGDISGISAGRVPKWSTISINLVSRCRR